MSLSESTDSSPRIEYKLTIKKVKLLTYTSVYETVKKSKIQQKKGR